MSSLFRVTPTPPTFLKLEVGQEGSFSFTIECLAAPDQVHEIILQALLVGLDGKAKEVDWLVPGPRRTFTIAGGKTETVTIAVRPHVRSPRGESTIKMVIADQDRPNDLFAESSPVVCEVIAKPGKETPPRKIPWLLIAAIAGGGVLVGGGIVLAIVLRGDDHPLTVVKIGDGTGEVTSIAASEGDAAGIRCGNDCAQDYPEGASVTLHAAPASGTRFAGWGGACSGTADCTVTLAAAVAVTVEFRRFACTPSTTVCDNTSDQLTVCDAAGNPTVTPCPLQCHPTQERCNDLLPSNGLAVQLDGAASAPAVDLPDGTVIETSQGTISTPSGPITLPTAIVDQATGGIPKLRVFIAKSVTINDITVRGGHALAFVAHGDITVQGRINAAGRGATRGPGAKFCNELSGLGGDGVASSSSAMAGGGGAGFASPGARGGSASGSSPGGAGGVAVGSFPGTATLTPLRGGCDGGGTRIQGGGFAQVGGGGGGAIQLSSRTAVSIVSNASGTGIIDVGGGGGPQGPNNQTGDSGGGGGGGGGGGVLLEAPVVTVQGASVVLAAHGGGGGGGCNEAGADGTTANAPALGGDCGSSVNQTTGGNGGTAELAGDIRLPTPGRDATGAIFVLRAAGGGGGSAGHVRINTANGNFLLGPGARIQAATSVGAVIRR
jgi:Divergent InlB B-repeat domain